MIVSPVPFVKFSRKKIDFHQSVTPLDGATRGGPTPPLPLVTPLVLRWLTHIYTQIAFDRLYY